MRKKIGTSHMPAVCIFMWKLLGTSFRPEAVLPFVSPIFLAFCLLAFGEATPLFLECLQKQGKRGLGLL